MDSSRGDIKKITAISATLGFNSAKRHTTDTTRISRNRRCTKVAKITKMHKF